LLRIFKKVENSLSMTTPDIFQTENCMTLRLKLDLNNDTEIFVFLTNTSVFYQNFFILIKDLGLIKLKKK
jgi:hypothetical protein